MQTVARDTSEWVRAVVPAVYTPEGAVSWTVYFDAETAVDGVSSFSSSRSRKRLPKEVAEALTALSGDTTLPVRSAAAMCLFANREKADLRALAAMLESAPEKRMMAYRLSSLLQETPVSWLREMNTGDVLALVDAVMAQIGDDDDSRLNGLRKQLVSGSAAADKPKVVLRKSEAVAHEQGRPASAAVLSSGGPPAPAATRVGQQAASSLAAQRPIVFFRNPGCRDCARVADLLRALRSEFTDMKVEELNIRNPDDARVDEALCDRFEVPDKYRLTAPAIFCGAGYLIKGEITFEKLGRLLSRTEATETAWRQVSEAALARADTALGERYAAMGPWIVAGAGLLDGINPCAFATIIFLLSYLQVTRREPREILAVGAAFVAGVFIAYFLLGLGLVEVVVRLALLRRAGLVLNWGMAAFVAGVAVLSVWDGIQCLRGRMGDMVLQLPGVLKARIHEAVRRSSRHRHFVAAAFVAGLAIAVLELACTGQVYAPTLLYMLKTGQGRAGAIGYLGLYNAAFIVPLLIVFAGAYGGLRSERLTAWLRRRAAVVKFATAILFAALFALFVFGSLV
jgi:cytochrome c biogenesis protein CcdA